MTIMELVRVAEELQELAPDLLSALVDACDHCDNCQLDTPCKLMTGPVVPRVSIPSYMLEEAGLDPDCKLVCTAEQGRGEVRVTEAEYRFDLTDLRPDMLEMLRECDVCLSDLEEKLIQDTIVYS